MAAARFNVPLSSANQQASMYLLLHLFCECFRCPLYSECQKHRTFDFIGSHGVDDFPGFAREQQRRVRVEVVALLGRQVDDHAGVRVATERVLQQSRQLRRAVGNARLKTEW